jgi:hypothetical protein
MLKFCYMQQLYKKTKVENVLLQQLKGAGKAKTSFKLWERLVMVIVMN